VGSLLLGCEDKPAPAGRATAESNAQTPTTAAATALGAAPTAAPVATGYSLDGIKTVADNCATPSVVLATAPKSVGASYPWNITRQALLANQQFRVVAGAPAQENEVQLATHTLGEAFALVAKCRDGGTCNRLAAMYKGIVRSARPQVYCGVVPSLSNGPVHAFTWAATPEGNLPGASDTVAQCGRLNACMIATDRSTSGDPFVACQKAPSKFKTACARNYPCAEVIACMNK
jgi:hypothetical protein